jgi:PAS domain S-box-containing protein
MVDKEPESPPSSSGAPTTSGEYPFRSTLDHLLEGFQIIAHDWTYVYVNPAAARHGRRSPDELHGRKMWEAYPGIQDTPLFAVLTRCMRERTATSFENQFAYPGGTTRWFELRVVPVPEGLCVHSFDVQARKDADAALRKLNRDLEARVTERTRQLTAVNEELEAFSYSVSHDLRAPLAEIEAYLADLRDRSASVPNEEGQELLQKTAETARRMEQLIDDLLAFSRASREPVRKRRVSLTDIARGASDQVAKASADREIVWTIGTLPEVDADPALLHLAMVNLLANAVKFTRGRSPARIDITGQCDEVVGEVVIAVRDNGVGFDPRYAGKLFGVFQRLHAQAGFEGSGIGLANVRRIVSRHGGRTWAEGSVDGGATFYVALPTGSTKD